MPPSAKELLLLAFLTLTLDGKDDGRNTSHVEVAARIKTSTPGDESGGWDADVPPTARCQVPDSLCVGVLESMTRPFARTRFAAAPSIVFRNQESFPWTASRTFPTLTEYDALKTHVEMVLTIGVKLLSARGWTVEDTMLPCYYVGCWGNRWMCL